MRKLFGTTKYKSFELKRPSKSDLLKLAYCMFFYYSSTYHKDFYDNIIRKNLKLTTEEYEKNFI